MRDRPTPRARGAYPEMHRLQTRWRDNDQFGHMYNATYFELFDEAMNMALLPRGLLDHRGDGPISVVVENGCVYFREVAYPDPLDIGVLLSRIGNSSFRLELGMFRDGETLEAARAHFSMVAVNPADHCPVPLPDSHRAALSELRQGGEG